MPKPHVSPIHRSGRSHDRRRTNHVFHNHDLLYPNLLHGRVAKLRRPVFVSDRLPPVLPCVTQTCFYSSTFFLFVFTLALVMKAWFRAVAAAFGDPAPAQTVAGLMLLTLVLYTGYAIPKPSVIGALKWITYINVSVCQTRDFCLCSRSDSRYGMALRASCPTGSIHSMGCAPT